MQTLEEHDVSGFISREELPDCSAVDKCYEAVLEAQMVPPHVRQHLSKETGLEKKWKTIKAFYSMMGNEAMVESNTFGEVDRTILEKMRNFHVRPEMSDVLNMKSRISTANKAWMEAWIDADGMVIFVKAIEQRAKSFPMGEVDTALLYEMICSMKMVINTGITMEKFLSTEGAIRSVTSSLTFVGCKPLTTQVLEVLAVLCDYSSEACRDVVIYLREHSRSRKERPFAMLIEGIAENDVEVRASVMLFVNSMLGSTFSLEDRVVIRADLEALGLTRVVQESVQKSTSEQESIERGQERGFVPVISESDKHSKPSSDAKPIDPERGIMSGMLVASKHHQGGMLRALGASKATKRRLFVLEKESLHWWHPDELQGAPAGTIDVKDIVEVHPYGHGEDIYKITPHIFEIVTSSRTHTLGADSEEIKQNWITALTVCMDKNILEKSSYSILSSKINISEFKSFSEFLLKQIKIYEAIAESDHAEVVSASGVDVTNPTEVIKYVEKELASLGLGSYLIRIVQEFIVIPVDSAYAEKYWKMMLRICQEMRSTKLRDGDDGAEFSDLLLLKTEDCLELLEKKEISTGSKAVSELNKLKLQLYTKDDEINRLKLELQNRKNCEPAAGLKEPSSDSSTTTSIEKSRSTRPTAASTTDSNSNTTSSAGTAVPASSVKRDEDVPIRSTPAKLKVDEGGALGALFGAKGGGRSKNNAGAAPSKAKGPKSIDEKPGKLDVKQGGALGALFAGKGGMGGPQVAPAEKSNESDKPGKLRPDEGGALGALFGGKGGKGRGGGRGATKLGAAGRGGAVGALFGAKGGSNVPSSSEKPSMKGSNAAVTSRRSIPAPPDLPPGAAQLLGVKAGPGGPGAPSVPKGKAAKKQDPVPVSKHQPSKKMKGVFWNKLRPNDVQDDCMWKHINLEKLDDLDLDYNKLEETFGQAKTASIAPKISPASSSAEKKKESLLDGKRTQNVLITFGKIKKTPSKVVDMLVALDPLDLSYDVTELLQNVVPTAEEIKLLTSYDGDPNSLAPAEQNLLALTHVPRLEKRLLCHKIVFVWNATAERLRRECSIVQDACHQILTPSSLQKLEKVLSVVLAVGNFMNGGTSRVASAVSLDSILKFGNVKTNDNKKTLLHFVVRQLKEKYSDSLNFYEEWSCIHKSTGDQTAADLSFSNILTEKKSLEDDLRVVEQELAAVKKLTDHAEMIKPFENRVEVYFLGDAEKVLLDLNEMVAVSEKKIRSALSAFGYKASSDEDLSKGFFSTLVEIISLIKKTCGDVDKWIEQEKKAAENTKKSEGTAVSPEDKHEGKDKRNQQNIFGAFRDQQQASSDDIILQLKKKMELRRQKAEAQ